MSRRLMLIVMSSRTLTVRGRGQGPVQSRGRRRQYSRFSEARFSRSPRTCKAGQRARTSTLRHPRRLLSGVSGPMIQQAGKRYEGEQDCGYRETSLPSVTTERGVSRIISVSHRLWRCRRRGGWLPVMCVGQPNRAAASRTSVPASPTEQYTVRSLRLAPPGSRWRGRR